jgi:hypothetical protein
MKKLMFILLIVCCQFLANSQNPEKSKFKHQVFTVDGQVLNGNIQSYLSKKIIFYDDIKELNGNSISIENVIAINGPMAESRKNRILGHNPIVKFNEELSVKVEPILISPMNKERFDLMQKTPGDLIKTSAVLRLTGLSITAVSSTILLTFPPKDKNVTKIIGIFTGITGLALYINSEITLIKAGKLMNEERITIAPASEGIGMAIKF